MRKLLTLGLALWLALFLGTAGTSLATEAQSPARLIIVGDTPDATTITDTTAQVATYVTADQNIRLNQGGGGTWAAGTDAEVEWCWTAPSAGPEEISRAFKFTLAYSMSTTDTVSSSWATIGVDTDATLAAGDEIGFIPVTHHVLAADVSNATVIEYATLTSGGCFGILVDSAGSGNVITIHHFTLEAEQLVTTR